MLCIDAPIPTRRGPQLKEVPSRASDGSLWPTTSVRQPEGHQGRSGGFTPEGRRPGRRPSRPSRATSRLSRTQKTC
jgi:hypothetical protein